MTATTTTTIRTQLQIHCGCGFKAVTVAEAKSHAEESGHMMTIQGTMASVERAAEGSTRSYRRRSANVNSSKA